MKTSTDSVSDRPRFVCRMVQGWVAVLGDGRDPRPGSAGARHVAGCAGCSLFFHTGKHLDTSLRRAAATGAEPVTPGLDQRIIRALQHRPRAAERPLPRVGPGSLLLAGAAAVAGLVTLIIRESSVPGNEVGTSPTVAAVASAPAAESVLERLQPGAAALLEGAPLQQEAAAFYSDARSALGFLALNFLPAPVEEAAPELPDTAPGRRRVNG